MTKYVLAILNGLLLKDTDPTGLTNYLRDYEGKAIKGSFYEHELLKSKAGNVYLIEKVIQRKGDRMKVRWLGFDGTHDSWINKKDVV